MAQRGAWTPQKVRDRIRTSMLTKRLTDHVLGKVEMTSSQVTAGLGLLKKTLPDLAATENTHIGDADRPIHITSTDGEL